MHKLYAKLSVNSYFKIALLILPIIIFYLPILLTGDKLHIGDFDMQVQMTEAARIIISQYHQFPFWNPWISGGVPLFADPQFGLFTPQTFLSFFIGSVMAWKITLVLYLIVGFFSMKSLLDYFSSKAGYANILISYIWIFSSFFVLRAGGHFTFLFLALLPLAILLALKSSTSNKHLFALSALLTYCLYAAMHYSTVLIILCVLFIALGKPLIDVLLNTKKTNALQVLHSLKRTFIRVLLAIIIAVVLASPRIYLSLEYLQDNGTNRTALYEKFIGLPNGLRSIACPYQVSSCVNISDFKKETTWGFFEASSYAGITTLIVFISLLGVLFVRRSKVTLRPDISIILSLSSLALVSFVLGLGGKPYSLFRELPLMSSMRVSTRWFFITLFCLLVLTAILYGKTMYAKSIGRRTKRILAGLLIISFVEVVYFNAYLNSSIWIEKNMYSLEKKSTHQKIIKQERLWEAPNALVTRYYALTEATANNRGQIVADNALVDTTLLPTQRCDQDDPGCDFVKSRNAKVITWTPQKLVLRRTHPGPIELNMNPGSHWQVNKKYIYLDMKIVDSSQRFVISDNAKNIVIVYKPIPNVLK